MPTTPTPIPPAFHLRKTTILSSLARSSNTYTDLSPKGSIDIEIRPLIERLNALEGVVTTSSCAGRISVFLEGGKGALREGEGEGERAVPGGRWLFVSHDPLDEEGNGDGWGRILGVEDGRGGGVGERGEKNDVDDGDGDGGGSKLDVRRTRFVRFQFEPMILHILTASLPHAQPILSAAINAGFRESGIQSLKTLSDPHKSFPMVAVRSAGLGLGAIIGYSDTTNGEEGDRVRSMVTEEYLGVLVRLANERFEANRLRMRRFEEGVEGVEGGAEGRNGKVKWEEKEIRKARKRAEGLAMKESVSESERRRREKSGEEQEENGTGIFED